MDRDLTLVERLAALYPAVVADCLDKAGLRNQVLAPHIRPIAREMRVAGLAATVHCVEVDAVPASRDDCTATSSHRSTHCSRETWSSSRRAAAPTGASCSRRPRRSAAPAAS